MHPKAVEPCTSAHKDSRTIHWYFQILQNLAPPLVEPPKPCTYTEKLSNTPTTPETPVASGNNNYISLIGLYLSWLLT
jgi:hypothetical protein